MPMIMDSQKLISDKEIQDMISDICHFIHREICNRKGVFFDHDGYLAKDDKYKSLVEWENSNWP